MKKVSKQQIKEAAIAHSKKVLGNQFDTNQCAAKSIQVDFISGVEWIHELLTKDLN